MRKLPDHCPDTAYFDTNSKTVVDSDLKYSVEYPCVPIELAPVGSRALLDEALKMVERYRDEVRNYALKLKEGDPAWQKVHELNALLAKAREGEGT